MGINVYYLVMVSFNLLWISLSTENDFICEEDRKHMFYLCKPPKSNGEFTIPEDVLNKAEFVKVKTENINATWLVTKPDIFHSLPYLTTLHINTSKSWTISDSSEPDKLKYELFTVPTLEILRVVYMEEFNKKQHNWSLTDNLMNLYVENSVMDFDLTTCDNLHYLSLINASLLSMPENKGLYYLSHLDLRKNSLTNLTVYDLATFCSLHEINMADALIEECECKRIHKLFEHLMKNPFNTPFSAKYVCPHTNKNCTKLDWEKIEKMKEPCVKSVSSNVILHTFIIVSIVTFFLFSFIVACVYILGHLGEKTKVEEEEF